MSTPTPSQGPQIALLTSLLTYPLIFFLVTPRNATPSRFSQSREALSILHSTLVTLASAHELHTQSKTWPPNPPSPSSSSSSSSKRAPPTSTSTNAAATTATCPLITTPSPFGNSITAFEMGYLVQDTLILLLAARLRARGRGGGLVKEINWRVLGWHHAGLTGALGVLQWYIARGREKGVLVILMLMLMNASTPIGTVHWYLVNFRPEWRGAVAGANAGYLLMYGVFRVGIVPWILHVFGGQMGCSALEAFWKLRVACQLGTATIGASNLIWFVLGVRKFVRRYLGNATLRKGK